MSRGAPQCPGRCATRKRVRGALAALLLLVPTLAGARDVLVFAAASLGDALQALAGEYRERSAVEVRFSIAASSTLARQIEAGAPAQIVALASEPWMDYLAERGRIEPGTRLSLLGNRLALIAPAASGASAIAIGPGVDLATMLGDEGRLALGDPDHVPAGIYAREALERLGWWQRLAPRLARADNVRAALALVTRGEAALGIVYATDARLVPGISTLGLFPSDAHSPLRYPFAIVRGEASAEVRELFRFITGARGLAVFERHGFTRP